ncbi:MAG: methyltransferase domain-containing protein [Pseudomonadota bacterium]|nr:methyltransferase domain-containing protein [Pseudomonadota bacterium]
MNLTATPLDLGDLRRVTPIDSGFGLGRGKPVDRHYIEDFLRRHEGDIHGRVLEVAEDTYTREYGGAGVTCSDILHADGSNPRATLTGDLAADNELPDASFDCFICTQTLTYIYDVQRAVRTIERILKPGGVLLATVPGISQMSPYDRDRWGEYWRFTAQSLGRLLGDVFGHANVVVEAYGNVLASTAFLQGMSVEDLRLDELDHRDQRYQMLVAGRAVKPRLRPDA